jgi:hypothetical protein
MSDYIRSVTTIPLPPQTAMPILDFEVRKLNFHLCWGEGEKSVLLIRIFLEAVRYDMNKRFQMQGGKKLDFAEID